jgi:acylphosphatase
VIALVTKAFRVVIRGIVQGVLFRASMSEVARRNGVAGWVRNRVDGSVEAHIEGDEDAVRRVIEWARHGPPRARVDSVTVLPSRVRNMKGFRIVG